jgi:hypothetical protein
MGSHVPDKGSVRYHDTACPHRDGEGEIQSVIGGMVDGDADTPPIRSPIATATATRASAGVSP